MRIAMVDPSLFTLPYDNDLAAGLTRAGHEVTLYARKVGSDDNELGNVTLNPVFYAFTNRPSINSLPRQIRLGLKGLDHAWSMTKFLRLLNRNRPDIIHFQWLPLPIVDQRILSSFRKIAPLVLTVHDTNPFNGDPSAGLQSRGAFACFRFFDRLIAHTQQGVSRLSTSGVPADKLVLLPHGRSQPMVMHRGSDGNMQGLLTFVLFGKLKPYKGVDTLIEAFAQLPKELQKKARVRVIGKAYMDLSTLEARIQHHQLTTEISIENRFVPDSEIGNLFGDNVVAVFPYREIEASGVMFQALAYKRPIIASKVGAFAELLQDGLHGHLIAPDDVSALTAALAHFIEDRAFAAKAVLHCSELGMQTADWDYVAHRTADVYRAAGST